MRSTQKTNSLTILLMCLITLLVTITAAAQQVPDPPFTLTQVRSNVWVAIGLPQGQSNAGFVIGDNGVLIIDTAPTVDANNDFSANAARALVAEIRKRTDLPIKYAVNTHYHLDHIGGNATYSDLGAVLLGHRNIGKWIVPENLKLFGGQIKPAQKAFIEALPTPSLVYDSGVDLYLGKREIRIRSYPGHTGGDSVVVIPDAKTVFTGDLLFRNALPNLIDATTLSWIDTLAVLAKDYPDYAIVPGHGELGIAQDLTTFREYLVTLRRLVMDAQAQKKTGAALVETVMAALKPKYGQLDFFSLMAQRNIQETDAELRGTKTIPR
jgi:glyoxylase-like metal-dependent hydrolase (beta-lactamase superfamily II)